MHGTLPATGTVIILMHTYIYLSPDRSIIDNTFACGSCREITSLWSRKSCVTLCHTKLLVIYHFSYMFVQRYVAIHFTSSYHYNTTSFRKHRTPLHHNSNCYPTLVWFDGWTEEYSYRGPHPTLLISIVNVKSKKKVHHYCSYKYIRTCLSPLVLLQLGNEPIVPQQTYIRSPV